LTLLDTHVLVWVASEPRRLTRTAAAAVRKAAATGGLLVASITLWELAVLFADGRLRARTTVERAIGELVEATRVVVRELTPEIAAMAAQAPPGFPRDPADRIIAATARTAGCSLVTADEHIAASGWVRVSW
jgi:PIN domain nuclease of toxin-antitoxin system